MPSFLNDTKETIKVLFLSITQALAKLALPLGEATYDASQENYSATATLSWKLATNHSSVHDTLEQHV